MVDFVSRRLEPEFAYLFIASKDFRNNQSSEYHGRILANFLHHLADHVAEVCDVADSRFVASESNSCPRTQDARLGRVRALVWKILGEGASQKDIQVHKPEDWVARICNASKHGVTRKRFKGNDSRAFTSLPSWEAYFFWEDMDQVVHRDELGNRLQLEHLLALIEQNMSNLIQAIGLDEASILRCMPLVLGTR